MNRQRLILFILLIALVAAVIWSFWATPRPKVAPTLKYAPGQRGAAGSGTPGRPAPPPALPSDARILRLGLLDQGQDLFKGYRRNIFKPLFVDEIKVMQNRAAALKQVKPPPLPPPPAPPPKIAPPLTPAEERAQQTRRELARFVFKGFLSKDQQKTIFLSKDSAIFLVKKGDIFEKRYKAASITEQALTIQVTDTGEEIVIPLMENLSLRAVP
ncbi:hypothetical protein FO488_06810 [Geobacter sp. FeAm09]|uniref:hypothetical protein n=1 Tax=Geobacter sp. FeAm09 TaxID=2597769 RepID=UPI0011EDEA76|nr:hypothetical protein [Geobacter sp. FeAm09]QEM67894.1 hypothetical protein FO488_06810 [Geobacter sp. FeAm09]